MPAAHFVAADACSGVLTALCGRAKGRRFPLGEAQALQERAEQELQLCKPWLPTHAYQMYSGAFAASRVILVDAAAASPGQAMLPARQRMVKIVHEKSRVACSGCSQQVYQLRKCTACRAVSYCSRECQVRHWKEGGHRRECAQLAAAAGASTATAT
jgi:hypothetical protein